MDIHKIIKKSWLSIQRIVFGIFLSSNCLANHIESTDYVERTIDTYDWNATNGHVIGNRELYVYFGAPLDEDRTNISNEIYWLILQYANDFIEVNEAPADFEYVFNFVGPGQHIQIYFGNAWLAQGNTIAFLELVDYETLKWLVEMRVPEKHEFDDLNVFPKKHADRFVNHHKFSEDTSPLPPSNKSAEAAIKKIESFAKDKIDGIKEKTGRRFESENLEYPDGYADQENYEEPPNDEDEFIDQKSPKTEKHLDHPKESRNYLENPSDKIQEAEHSVEETSTSQSLEAVLATEGEAFKKDEVTSNAEYASIYKVQRIYLIVLLVVGIAGVACFLLYVRKNDGDS